MAPASVLYSTRAPSASVRKPSDSMSLWWTKRSLPDSSGVMKPNPFSSLNHLTTPWAMVGLSYVSMVRPTREALPTNHCDANTLLGCRRLLSPALSRGTVAASRAGGKGFPPAHEVPAFRLREVARPRDRSHRRAHR